MADLISRQDVLALLEQVNERVEDGYGFDLEAITLSILDLPGAERCNELATSCKQFAIEKRTEERTETHACDLISREALLKDIEKYHVSDGQFQHWVEVQPAAPVREVVLCKDCKHRDVENGFCEGRGWPMQLVPDDGFCDKGVKNDG